MNQDSQQIVLSIKSDPKNLQMVRDKVTSVCQGAGFDEEWTGRIVLAIDEAITNVIRHAYNNDPSQEVQISVRDDEDALRISIRDFGPKPNPESLNSRDLKDVRPGGLGCHFIKEIMDEVEYDITSHEVGTELKLVKRKEASS